MIYDKEYILCSAINVNDIVVCGRRHSDCYDTLNRIRVSCDVIVKHVPDRKEQGFLTSNNRFVDRVEAWKIAKYNNQIKYGIEVSDNGDNSELISENLYFDDL